jgi:hypothetical protein
MRAAFIMPGLSPNQLLFQNKTCSKFFRTNSATQLSSSKERPHARRALLNIGQRGRKRAKGLKLIWFPNSNLRSLPAHTRREHFPLDASLLNELSFSNFPLLYSSRSGVLCHTSTRCEAACSLIGAAQMPDGEAQTQASRPQRDGLPAPLACSPLRDVRTHEPFDNEQNPED